MVAVRSTHIKQNSDFNPDVWVKNLGQKAQVSKQILETYNFCKKQVSTNADSQKLLWRGREMVEILLSLSMDQTTIIAALIFPLYNTNHINIDLINESYGKKVGKMLEGVQQMAAIQQLNAAQKGTSTSTQVDSVRRMLLSMVEDFRCVIIKLAERISYLREVKDQDDAIRLKVAKECANIYAPLANRLGIGQLKWEIEDFTFRFQHPTIYKQIAKQLSERRIDREEYIDDFVSNLSKMIAHTGVNADVYGRPKHIYSIWRKMQKKNLAFDELFDVRAVRIITSQLQDCYAALGVVHTNFKHLPHEFDDYVANPKPNGYQSIHTVVLGPGGKPIEIQIRTKQMHDDAELGVAAHWKYKEGSTGSRSAYDEKISWLRKLIAWQEEMSDSDEVMEELRSQVFDDRVYVFTPSGDVVDLPSGATPLDFAYQIHSEVGHRCIGVKVAGRIVPYTYELQMGDQVEIITQKEPNPSRDWLNPATGYVTTNRSRSKIQAWFRKQDKDKNIAAGKDILEIELAKIHVNMKDVEKHSCDKFNVNNLEEIFAGIGCGDIRINQLINHLDTVLNQPTGQDEDNLILASLTENQTNLVRYEQENIKKGAIVVEGVNNLMTHLARCCQPIPGDEICGYVTQGRGISVHRADCEQLAELRLHAPDRIIDTVWGNVAQGKYYVTIRVISNERSGMLKEITSSFSNEKIKVSRMKSKVDFKQNVSVFDFDLEIANVHNLTNAMKKLSVIKDVLEVSRLN